MRRGVKEGTDGHKPKDGGKETEGVGTEKPGGGARRNEGTEAGTDKARLAYREEERGGK